MSPTKPIPTFNTPGVIATELGVPIHRVLYVLKTRKHIRPAARAGVFRVYSNEAIAQVRHELSAIDARCGRKAERNAVEDQTATSLGIRANASQTETLRQKGEG